MQRRRLPVIITAFLFAILAYMSSAVILPPSDAQAHAYVIGSDPIDGSTINKVPGQVRIYFNATISSFSIAHIYAVGSGNLVEITGGPSQVSSANPRELVTPLKHPASLPLGGYEVMWTAVSNNDAHTTFGLIGFNVGFSSTGASGVPTLGPSTSNSLDDIHTLDLTNILAIAWEWLIFMAVTFWVGILVVEGLLLTDEERSSDLLVLAMKHTYTLQWLCLTIILFGEIISLILRVTRLTQVLHSNSSYITDIFNLAFGTNYGRFWLIRIVLLVVALGLLYRAKHSRAAPAAPELVKRSERYTRPLHLHNTQDIPAVPLPAGRTTQDAKKERTTVPATPVIPTPRHRFIWLLLAGVILLMFVLSQSVTQVLQPHISAVVFAWLYLVAQSVWFGSFAYLGFVLLPLFASKELDYRTETLVNLLRRLAPFLLAAIGVLLVSDLFLSEASISDPRQLINDPFGRTLVVQIALLAVILCLSLYVLYSVRPRLTRQALLLPVVDAELPARRTRQSALGSTGRSLKLLSTTLALLGGAVLLCAALQSFFAPPIDFPDVTYSNQPQLPASAVNTQTKAIGNLSVTLELLPGRSGYVNTVILNIEDARGKPVTDAQVRLTTSMQTMDMETGHANINGGNPLYVTTFDKRTAFSMTGPWVISVEIQRPGQASVRGTFQVVLS